MFLGREWFHKKSLHVQVWFPLCFSPYMSTQTSLSGKIFRGLSLSYVHLPPKDTETPLTICMFGVLDINYLPFIWPLQEDMWMSFCKSYRANPFWFKKPDFVPHLMFISWWTRNFNKILRSWENHIISTLLYITIWNRHNVCKLLFHKFKTISVWGLNQIYYIYFIY